MKMIIAYIQPFMESRVMAALHQMPEVSGATFSVVRGFGRGRLKREGSHGEANRDDACLVASSARARLEIFVPDSAVDKVRSAIQSAAHTGNPGDGKILVLPVERCVQIRTGEEGDTSL